MTTGSNSFPDYYEILSISPSASLEEIKTAYKRKSLIHHPDRISTTEPNSLQKKKEATLIFQSISDAFYTLSDSTRRANYDRLRSQQPKEKRTSDPNSSKNYFDYFSNLASGFGAAGSSSNGATGTGTRVDPEFVFSNVFEDLLRPELEKKQGGMGLPVWRVVGAVSGAGLGFIAGNVPGLFIGGFAGSKLGSIRDVKGKALIEVFKDLGADQKAEVLKVLIAKVFGMAGIGSTR